MDFASFKALTFTDLVQFYVLGLSLSLALLVQLFPPSAQGRLGQSISDFEKSEKERLKLHEVLIKDEKKFYQFNLLFDEEDLAKAPGFKAGVTITVSGGKIAGQSLAICLGDVPNEGNRLCVDTVYRFACESFGRDAIEDKKALTEKVLFQQAIFLSLAGQAQELKFPDSEDVVVFKRSKENNLLVACLVRKKSNH